MKVDKEKLRVRIQAEPDVDCEVGPMTADKVSPVSDERLAELILAMEHFAKGYNEPLALVPAALRELQSLRLSLAGGVLDDDAQVGNTIFRKGVPCYLVIKRAQREYQYRHADTVIAASEKGAA